LRNSDSGVWSIIVFNKGIEIMSHRTASDIEESTEKLLEDLKAVVHDGEELLHAGVNELSERGKAARDRLAAALEVAKETRRKLEARAREGAYAADRAIREHPYESIGIAFGVGLLLGVLVTRRQNG
jgi:ElaB/YqjD/DUF883 family membrane-anchored ribosome-binding protein